METSIPNHFNYKTDRHSSPLQKSRDTFFSKLKKITTISEILRLFGASAVIASMSLFLLNGWSDGNDIQRYLKLLCQTGLLTIAGLILSFVFKENKGARLFFGLSLISVVANFMILGALTYSIFQLDGNLIQYPSQVTWTAINTSIFWPVFAVAVSLLAILTRFSFSIFARNISAPLSLNFLLMSSLLLIPVRSSLAVSVIAISAILFATVLVKKLNQKNKVVPTNETKFALSLIFVPGLLIIIRALSLYRVDEIMLITLSCLAYFSLRFLITQFSEPSLTQKLIEKIQFCVAIFLSFNIISLLPAGFNDADIAAFSVLMLALTYDQIKASKDEKWHHLIITLSTTGLVSLNVLCAFFSENIIYQISSLLICAGLLLFTTNKRITREKHISKSIALVGVIASLLILAAKMVAYVQLGNWILIGLLGIALIISGSLFERYGIKLFSSPEDIT